MAAPAWLDHAILAWGYWVVLGAVLLESMGVPFPGESGLLAAAIYAGTGRPLNIALVIVAASAGAIMGDNFGYVVGYFGGYPLVRRILQALRVKESALAFTQAYFERHGDKTVFIGRFFALLRVTVAFLAGVNHMTWRRFVVWNALGGIAWATVYGLLGYFLGHNLTLLGEVMRVIGVGGTVLLVTAIAALIIFFVVRRRRDEAGRADAAPARPTKAARQTLSHPVGSPRSRRQSTQRPKVDG
ncbi:MAG TPA: DedA family protein [Ktedonobacterales bacterium]